ncbi:hypothetical protein RN001_000875 [Aquatica leii]|uniref:Macro domain-containing protein n=1 Tax=Aquatica leii TaxID=1421715 RepID=A0AAN7PFH9_9COLE|nr:hypothetical protein RN001_000875 [Aquatica leii]
MKTRYDIKAQNGGFQPGDMVRTRVISSRTRNPIKEMEFEKFMNLYGGSGKARFGVNTEEQQDLFQTQKDYKFGQLDELRRQQPAVGKVLRLRGDRRIVFYLVTKKYSRIKPLYKNLWQTLWNLKREMEFHHVKKLAVPKLVCGLDQLNWRTVRKMLEVVFRGTGIQVLVCS